jgi:hypothetical protein
MSSLTAKKNALCLFCGTENKGKKKKFKEGQAEQVLDDLFFEAIKGVERLKPKYAFCDDIREFFKRDDIPKELFNLDIFDEPLALIFLPL